MEGFTKVAPLATVDGERCLIRQGKLTIGNEPIHQQTPFRPISTVRVGL